jgi:hypothetical protein
LNLSPKYNSQDYQNYGRVFTQTLLESDSVLNNFNNTETFVSRYNVKFNGLYEIKLDSNNTLKFSGNANYYNSTSSENYKSDVLGGNNNLKNSTQRLRNFKSESKYLSGSLNYQHKFKKMRRTFHYRQILIT